MVPHGDPCRVLLAFEGWMQLRLLLLFDNLCEAVLVPDLTPLRNIKPFQGSIQACRWLQSLPRPLHPKAWTAPTFAKHLYNSHQCHVTTGGNLSVDLLRHTFHYLSDVGALCFERSGLNSLHLPCSNGGYANNFGRLQRRRLAWEEAPPTISRRPEQ